MESFHFMIYGLLSSLVYGRDSTPEKALNFTKVLPFVEAFSFGVNGLTTPIKLS